MSKHQHYKSQGKKGLFDEQFSIEMPPEIGNPLAMVSKVIDFKISRPTLEDKLLNSDKKIMQGQTLLCGNDVQDHYFATILWSFRQTSGVSNI